VFRQASILLVDDDLEAREAIATMVQELGHRVVAAAATIRDASAFAMIAEFDLAILNISIDGYRIDPVAHLLQRRQRPILFITGSGTRWLTSVFRTFGAAKADLDRRFEGDNRRDDRSGSDRKLITM